MRDFDLGWIFETVVAASKILGVPLYIYGWVQMFLVMYGLALAIAGGWKG